MIQKIRVYTNANKDRKTRVAEKSTKIKKKKCTYKSVDRFNLKLTVCAGKLEEIKMLTIVTLSKRYIRGQKSGRHRKVTLSQL